jgi:two-component system, NtrC family, response regulator GlrR
MSEGGGVMGRMGGSPLDDWRARLADHLLVKHALIPLVGCSPAFREAIQRIPDIARSEATILVAGETGTGKKLLARALHYTSDRAGHPFVAINCSALPDTLLEDELFGHEPARSPTPTPVAKG